VEGASERLLTGSHTSTSPVTANGALAQATVLSVTASEAAASPPMAAQRPHLPSH